MRHADYKIVQTVKLKLASYIEDIMTERGFSSEDISEASGIDIDRIKAILNGGDYLIDHLFALAQVLRIHIMLESSNFTANLSQDQRN